MLALKNSDARLVGCSGSCLGVSKAPAAGADQGADSDCGKKVNEAVAGVASLSSACQGGG